MNVPVNLLPWRRRRARRQRRLAIALCLSIVAMGLAVGAGFRVSLRKEWQTLSFHNHVTRQRLKQLDAEIIHRQTHYRQLSLLADKSAGERRRRQRIVRLSRTINDAVAQLPPQVWLTRITTVEGGVRIEGNASIASQLDLWRQKITAKQTIGVVLTALRPAQAGNRAFTFELKEQK